MLHFSNHVNKSKNDFFWKYQLQQPVGNARKSNKYEFSSYGKVNVIIFTNGLFKS